ncbi:hypothetical protein A6V25_11190 [Nostoc sp. ATCC 53789]|nr:hypothetical protein A6V25_11190 [Nostoc sp. ATCC 53789]
MFEYNTSLVVRFRNESGVKGKGEGGKGLNPLPFTLSPVLTSAFLGWQTTSYWFCFEKSDRSLQYQYKYFLFIFRDVGAALCIFLDYQNLKNIQSKYS